MKVYCLEIYVEKARDQIECFFELQKEWLLWFFAFNLHFPSAIASDFLQEE